MWRNTHMLVINDKKAPGSANIKSHIEWESGGLLCLLRSVSGP